MTHSTKTHVRLLEDACLDGRGFFLVARGGGEHATSFFFEINPKNVRKKACVMDSGVPPKNKHASRNWGNFPRFLTAPEPTFGTRRRWKWQLTDLKDPSDEAIHKNTPLSSRPDVGLNFGRSRGRGIGSDDFLNYMRNNKRISATIPKGKGYKAERKKYGQSASEWTSKNKYRFLEERSGSGEWRFVDHGHGKFGDNPPSATTSSSSSGRKSREITRMFSSTRHQWSPNNTPHNLEQLSIARNLYLPINLYWQRPASWSLISSALPYMASLRQPFGKEKKPWIQKDKKTL